LLIPLLLVLIFLPPASAQSQSAVFTFPFQYSASNHSIRFRVMINRQGPFWIKLDTGASVSVISPQAAERAHIQVVGNSMDLGAYGSHIWLGVGKIAELKIGHLVLNGSPCAIGAPDAGPHCDGILAGSLIDNYAVQLDFKTKTISLYPGDSYMPPPGAVCVPFQFDKDHLPVCNVVVDGFPAAMEVDTGFSGLLELLPDMVEKNDLADKYRRVGAVTIRSLDSTKKLGIYEMKRVTLGGAGRQVSWSKGLYAVFDGDFGPLATSYDYDGRIGTQLLASHTVTFDYPHSRLVFSGGVLRN